MEARIHIQYYWYVCRRGNKVLHVFVLMQKHPDGDRPVISGKKIGIFSFACFVFSATVSLGTCSRIAVVEACD